MLGAWNQGSPASQVAAGVQRDYPTLTFDQAADFVIAAYENLCRCLVRMTFGLIARADHQRRQAPAKPPLNLGHTTMFSKSARVDQRLLSSRSRPGCETTATSPDQ